MVIMEDVGPQGRLRVLKKSGTRASEIIFGMTITKAENLSATTINRAEGAGIMFYSAPYM